MTTRIELPKVAPEAFKALMALETYMTTTPLQKTHKELIKIRASQINGCAFCINMHTTDARKQGETESRIFLLNAWRDSDLYSEEERAILAFTEEVTLIGNHVSDATYQKMTEHFDNEYIATVLMMAITINAWNRMAIATGLRA